MRARSVCCVAASGNLQLVVWGWTTVARVLLVAEMGYRKSAALGGNKQLAELLMSRSSAYLQAGLAREALVDLRVAADGGDATAQNDPGSYYMMGIEGVLALIGPKARASAL